MSDSPYGNTIFSRTNGGLGIPLTSRNISDTFNFGGPGAWIRYQLNWKYIETSPSTSGTPTYNWSCLDSVASACAAAGVNLLFVLQLAPNGNANQASPGLNRLRINAFGSDVGYGGTGALYASPADFKYFAQQVATRYNGTFTDPNTGQVIPAIPALQLGNEEYDTKDGHVANNKPGGRDDQGNRLGEMLKQAAPAVKAIYPTVKLGINAIRRVPTADYTRTHCIQWLTNVFTTIGSNAQYIDWVDFHNYRQDPTLGGNDPRAQDPSWDYPQTSAGGWPYGADVPSVATRLTDMLSVLASFGHSPTDPHPIQVWLCETGWALFDDGTQSENPIIYVSPTVCSQYYQIAADQMRQNGGSKIMYWSIDSTKKMHNYTTPYVTSDVNGNTVTITQWCDEKDTIISIPVGSSTPTYYQSYTDFAYSDSGYALTYYSWTGGGSGGSGGTGGTSGSNIIVANDSFIRGNQSGWGTASNTTDLWTQGTGTATPSIVSNKGKLTGATGVNNMLLGKGQLINGDFKVRFSVSSTGSVAGLVFRRLDVNNNLRCEAVSGTLRFKKVVAGTTTTLSPTTTLTLSNSTNYWMHVNVSGNTYKVNVWADGSTESNTYQLTCTDSSITSAGQFGIHANPATSGSSVLFDQFSATTTTNTYYVSPSGNDSNNGSSASPWKTLSKVNASVQAGDSVFFADGNYTGGVTLTTSGTFSTPISLTSTNKQKATIVEPGGAGIGTSLLTLSADNLIIDGFEATGADCQYGIQINNNSDTIQNCWVHDVCNTLTLTGMQEGYGIGVPGASGYVNTATVIQSNQVERCGKKSNFGVIKPDSTTHCIYVMTNNSTGTGVVQNNLVIEAGGYGIAMYHNPQYWIVTNNTLINNTTGGISCSGDTANSYLSDYNTLQNNILMESGRSGYYPAIWSASDSCGSHNVFRTNLAFHPKHTAIYDFTPANSNILQIATNLPNANPNFVNYSNDGTGDYHLTSTGSPAVDSGTLTFAPLVDYDGNTRPSGGRIDVGCYESTAPLTITVGGVGVLFDEDIFKLSTKVNERWRCQFNVLDYTGTQFFSFDEQVRVVDSNLGTLFTGFIATVHQDKTKVYGSPATIHQIDCVDNRYKADKRTSNRLYTLPQPAGKIATDMVHDVLKAEGVIAYYASHTDSAESDWAQGTLTDVTATPNLGGDLELGPLGNVSQTITSSSDWKAGVSSNLTISGGDVFLTSKTRNWDNGKFANQTLYGNGHPTQFVDSKGRFNLTCTAQSETRSRLDFAGTWANGSVQVDIHLNNPGDFYSITYRTTSWNNNDKSYAYAIEISTQLIQIQKGTDGGSGPSAVLASQSVRLGQGWYTVLVDFHGSSHSVSVGGTQVTATDGTHTAAGYIALRNQNTHVNGTSTMQFDNFAISSALSGTWQSPSAISLSSIANIVTSYISWSTANSTGTAFADEVDVSVNGGTTFTKVSNGGALPLTPGTSGVGKSVSIRAILSTTNLNSIPHISAINWTVSAGYTSSGTRTSIPPTTYGADTFTRGDQSGWGTASDGQAWYFDEGDGTLSIGSNEGKVTGSGTFNFMRLGTKIASGINLNVRFSLAYIGDDAAILLRYSDTSNFYRLNFGNGVFFIDKSVNGVQTTLVQQTFSQSAGTFYWMRFKAKDNTLNARWWLDGNSEPTTWNMIITDNDLTGGYYGLYASPAGSNAVKFDNLTAVSAGVTPGLSLTPVGRVGSTFIGWNAIVPTNTTLGVDISLDGGTTWTDVSDQNGGPIPDITTQTDPSVDNFSSDSSAVYTSTSGTNGIGAIWTYDTTNDRIIAAGGSQAAYLYNTITAADIDLFCDMDYSDGGGLVWCFSDTNDYYALVAQDSQASTSNTLTLYKSEPAHYSDLILSDAPQAYYRLDETSGTTAADFSSFARDATYSASGITYSQTGAITTTTDTAILLDGTAGCVTLPSSAKPDGYAAFTFEMWINFTSIPNTTLVLATNSTTTSNNKGILLNYTKSTTTLKFAVGNGTTFGQASYVITLATGTWYYLAGTYDGATLTLYVNGSSVATASLTGTIAAGTNPVTIGVNTSATTFIPATIDECALYNVALSPARILTHYNYGEGQADRSTTQLAQTSINFIRGTYHRIRAKTLAGAMTIYFDDTVAITYTDPTPLAAGNPGLFQDGSNQYALRIFGAPVSYTSQIVRFYQLWMQPQGQDVTGITVHTRLRLATTDSSVSPQVETLTIAAFGPQINAGTLIPSADYRYTFISRNLDDLAKQSDYQWWIDPNLILYFNHRQAQPALWIPQSNNLGLPSDIILDSNLTVQVSGDLYRNRQILTGVTNTGSFVDLFVGNSNQTSFTLRYPIAPGTVPIIKKDNVAQAIGLKGATGKDWYYAESDSVIAQDAGDLVLTSSNTLAISYTGTFSDTVIVDNTVAQAALAATEGGTGIIEEIEDVSKPGMLYDAAVTYANQLLTRYCISGRTIIFATNRDGLSVGQVATFYVPEENLYGVAMIITAIDITFQTQPGNTRLYQYIVTASELAPIGSWQKLMTSGLLSQAEIK